MWRTTQPFNRERRASARPCQLAPLRGAEAEPGLGARGGGARRPLPPASPRTPRGDGPRRGSATPTAARNSPTQNGRTAAGGALPAPGPAPLGDRAGRGGARPRRRAGNGRPPLALPPRCLRRLPPAAAPRGDSGDGSG